MASLVHGCSRSMREMPSNGQEIERENNEGRANQLINKSFQ